MATAHIGSILRSLTYRLSTAAPAQLPYLIRPVTTALLECRPLFSSPLNPNYSNSSDTIVWHKFTTYLTTLANSKNASARFTAAAIIKTVIETGGWETLQAYGGPWVRALLAMLSKTAEPLATKKMVIATLSRIFMLTYDYPTLVREITTPSLPAYIATCLSLVSWQSTGSPKTVARLRTGHQLLQPIIESFCLLLPHHPTIFRAYLSQMRSLLLILVTPTPSHMMPITEPSQSPFSHQCSNPSSTTHAAQALFILLHICTSKNNESADWATTFDSVVLATHETATLVFRALHEEWSSVAGAPRFTVSNPTDIIAGGASSHVLGTPPWTSIHAGCERLTGLLDLIQTCITSHTAGSVSFVVGRVIDLLQRVMSVTVPRGCAEVGERPIPDAVDGLRINALISKDERDGLYAGLPMIHVAALRVLYSLCIRLGRAGLPVLMTLLEYILWIFKHESDNTVLRAQCYVCISRLLETTGTGMSKRQVSSIDPILTAMCNDILQTADVAILKRRDQNHGAKQYKKGEDTTLAINADSFLQPPRLQASAIIRPVAPHLRNAYILLSVALLKLPPEHISHSTRALLDRTATLSAHQSSMLASVLNPPQASALAKAHSSILPLLARATLDSAEVEGLLRPRMPVVQMKYGNGDMELNLAAEDHESSEASLGDDLPKMVEESISGHPIVDCVQQVLNDVATFTDESSYGEFTPLDAPSSTWTTRSSADAAHNANINAMQSGATVASNQKRVASEVDVSLLESKRARLEPDLRLQNSQSVASSRQEALPITTIPVLTTVGGNLNNLSRTAQPLLGAPEMEMQSGAMAAATGDEDFEMPEINMEPDTEEEDEVPEQDDIDEQDDQDELGQP